MVTIKEIADRLGVSISTVSKGLNGASDISDELKQIVLDTAVEMGYSTKRSRSEKYRKVAIFVENMEYNDIDDFGYDIVLGFKQNAFRQKFEVDVIPVTPALQQQERYDTYLLKNQYCGAFLIGFALHDEWMKQLETTTMPTVLLDNFIPENPTVGYVGTDSNEGIDMAVKYLHNLGHTNIAFLNGSLHSKVSDDRQTAFENSMKKCGLVPQKNLMAHGFYVADSAKYHVPGFLSNGATAIICGNDLIASGVINECKMRGFRIPEDISVIGFDDIPIASTTEPTLSTIRQERNELGRCALVALLSLINHIPISITLLRPQLIIRDSSGCAPIEKK